MSSETAMIMQAWAGVGSLIVALLVGAAQCLLIWFGLRQMNKASADRNRQLDQQEKAAADRHEKSMRAFEAVLGQQEKSAADRHEKSMRAFEAVLGQQEKSAADRHRESMRALEALIERTGRAS